MTLVLSGAIGGNVIICNYKNWRGEEGVRTFIYLCSYAGSNEYHKDFQILHVGYDLEKNAIRNFADRDVTNVRIGGKYDIGVRTNWHKIDKESGSSKFNHQIDRQDISLKPNIVNDVYGLQSRWKNEKWEKYYVFYLKFNNEHLGKVKVNWVG